MKKVSKIIARYVDVYRGPRPCRKCSMSRMRDNTGTKFAGRISREGHCRFFEQKEGQ